MMLGNGMWQLIRQSDSITILVLLILFFMSVVCWAVFIYALVLLRLRKRDLRRVINDFKQVQSAEELLALATKYSNTFPGAFLSENLLHLKSLLESGTQESAKEAIEYHIDQSLDRALLKQETHLPLFSTSAGVAPLLGLFGTVWGLVHAFLSISEKQAADITVVAPGIAQALMTTLAGLIVAIPAFVMYNYLSSQIRTIEQQLIVLADQVRFVMQRIIK